MYHKQTGTFGALYQPFKSLLSAEEELDLFHQYHNNNSNSKKAMEQLIVAHSPIIRRAEHQLNGYGIDSEDLISEGFVALVGAVKRFDPAADNRFSAYAYTCARGSMLSYIAKNYFEVNVCTTKNNKKLFYSLRNKVAKILREHETTVLSKDHMETLARDFGVTMKVIIDMYGLMFRSPVLLDDNATRSTAGGDTEPSKYNIVILSISKILSPEQLYSIMENTDLQQKIIDLAMQNVLDHRERVIFIAQNLSDKEDVRTLETLGAEFDISKERVRQIRNKAMDNMGAEIRRIVREGDYDVDSLLND